MVEVKDINFIPQGSGCYLFKDEKGKVIYVGKAKNLKKRVGNYFHKQGQIERTKQLVERIKEIDFILTKTEVEALLLENNLIKKYYPEYNIDLKDSRRYAYIFIHGGDYPWIEVVRKREEKGEYYGPFVSGAVRKLVMDVLTRNFRVLTKKPSPRMRKIIDKESYKKRINAAREILKGNVDGLLKDLEGQMKESSRKTYYEYSMVLRNQINALKTLKQKQIMEMTRAVDAHIINYIVISSEVYLLLFSIRKGVLEEKQEYNFAYYKNFLSDFLLQYYDDAPIPQEVIVPKEVDKALEEYLTKKSKRKVSIIIPKKGSKKDLLDLALHNVKTTFFVGSEHMLQLQKILEMEKLPRNIECFDISHLGGTNTVASMVSFQNGLANKSNYRRFRIREETFADDYLAMKEVIRRRYAGSLKNSLKNPDLIVIDGGKGQLSAALEVLKELKMNIKVISLAKKFEEIYVEGKKDPIIVDRKNKGLQLLQAIRDEAHRFAVSYQRLLRQKDLINRYKLPENGI